MAMNLPGELVWVLDMLGYDWPPLDEDEMRRAASIMRQFKDDVEGTVEVAETRVKTGVATALTGQASTSFANAWDTDRATNIQQLVDALDPVAGGIEVGADAVVALKVKVIAELVITAAQIAAAAASAIITLGASAAASAAIIALRKKALDVLTNIAVDQLAQQLLPLIIEPLQGPMMDGITAMLEAELVEGAIGDVSEFQADLDALDQAAGDLESNAADQERLADDFIVQLSSCQIFTG
ncbi:hypothetical protein FQ330_02025 [Agrococcus sediminis]|uniref:Outer membrane channel protein CpnT-like N-terminal domain-containing protein n=1 Tax=Agrococcus sediminis TaxID=2599924 RepID=A0A5M8QJH1_9MICO|nr:MULTISPECIES: hypothetical protein [Agrococcus]KAA6436215.1 hypothetical protein FQ330_02025 [Agrococcus sediminis]UOW01587.1 hypothetical protein MU522_04030 [Agrococcus sp. SCSIO52902]